MIIAITSFAKQILHTVHNKLGFNRGITENESSLKASYTN